MNARTMDLIVCECCDHAIEVNIDDQMTAMTFWSVGFEKDGSRLYWVWQALRGRPKRALGVILNSASVAKLIDTLRGGLHEAESDSHEHEWSDWNELPGKPYDEFRYCLKAKRARCGGFETRGLFQE